jgi:hypothetical protein
MGISLVEFSPRSWCGGLAHDECDVANRFLENSFCSLLQFSSSHNLQGQSKPPTPDTMAEVVGLISALYTIGKAGLNLYDTLTLFAEGIKTAERDVSFVAYEIKSTSDILLLIRGSLEESKDSRSNIVKEGRSILEGLATQCEFCHDLIKDLISYLAPYFDESKSSASRDLVRWGQRPKRVKFLDKWRWQQQKPNVDKLRGYLEGLKSNLGLVLPILHFEIAEERRAPSVTL